jgi:ABC-type phosphate transport system auxiliary subunit
VLLIPLGYLTVFAAPHAVSGAPWAQIVVRTTALSVATLPIALFALMGTRYYFDAPLFVFGAALTVAVAVTLLVVAFAR